MDIGLTGFIFFANHDFNIISFNLVTSSLPLQLEAAIVEEFVKFEEELQQPISWEASGGILRPKDYIDRWRILLWDRAFLPLFVAKSNLKFIKGIELRKMDDGNHIIDRVFFRYFLL